MKLNGKLAHEFVAVLCVEMLFGVFEKHVHVLCLLINKINDFRY